MQLPSIDFFETYTGVVQYKSLRMLWEICVNELEWVTLGAKKNAYENHMHQMHMAGR
jgi:hypothetical protein